MVIIYPTVIQPLFNKLSPLPEGELRTRTESLATKLKFPLKHLYEIDGSKRSSHSNAYFFGLPWVSISCLPRAFFLIANQSKHIVIFDTLIKESKPDEVEAVLGMHTSSSLVHQLNVVIQLMSSVTGITCTQRSCFAYLNSTSSPSLPRSQRSYTHLSSSVHSTSPRPFLPAHPPSSHSCCFRFATLHFSPRAHNAEYVHR